MTLCKLPKLSPPHTNGCCRIQPAFVLLCLTPLSWERARFQCKAPSKQWEWTPAGNPVQAPTAKIPRLMQQQKPEIAIWRSNSHRRHAKSSQRRKIPFIKLRNSSDCVYIRRVVLGWLGSSEALARSVLFRVKHTLLYVFMYIEGVCSYWEV